MSYAETLKSMTEVAVKAKESDPKEVAKRLLPSVLQDCERVATQGEYSYIFSYDGAKWRQVLENLQGLLAKEGISSTVEGAEIAINWRHPIQPIVNFNEVK